MEVASPMSLEDDVRSARAAKEAERLRKDEWVKRGGDCDGEYQLRLERPQGEWAALVTEVLPIWPKSLYSNCWRFTGPDGNEWIRATPAGGWGPHLTWGAKRQMKKYGRFEQAISFGSFPKYAITRDGLLGRSGSVSLFQVRNELVMIMSRGYR
jgi:hypothetical protein